MIAIMEYGKTGLSYLIWGLVNSFVLFGMVLVATYAISLGLRLVIDDPQYHWSSKFSYGSEMEVIQPKVQRVGLVTHLQPSTYTGREHGSIMVQWYNRQGVSKAVLMGE